MIPMRFIVLFLNCEGVIIQAESRRAAYAMCSKKKEMPMLSIRLPESRACRNRETILLAEVERELGL
jgi:hypothetical protein